ncbi:dihydrolipoamide acetyltransferase family protein [Faunimonas sp. B44]|uniref:dihydrolipoamide acetyltransferase family protein n=1 Tax=Faunimonas sp. B44 TaxID=3461493 RepID=UPI004044821B
MEVLMPQLGETVAEGTISTWFKSVGDVVEAGDNLFEIETDKVSMEVQAIEGGVLSEIRVASGETASVGTVVAVIGDAGSGAGRDSAQAKAEARTGAPDDAPGRAEPVAPAAAAAMASAPAAETRVNGTAAPAMTDPFNEVRTPERGYGRADAGNGIKVTPLARRLIAQHGIDLGALAAAASKSGAWRIGKDEVMAAVEQGAAAPAARRDATAQPEPAPAQARQAPAPRAPARDVPGEVVPFNAIRRQTAQRLSESWRTIPMAVQAVEVDYANVERVRAARKQAFRERNGTSLTYLPFIARAVCLAIAEYPRVTARVEGDGLVLSREVNLGIAVDLGQDGLVVPVIRNADELTVPGIAKAIDRQVEKARSGRLSPDDLSGGTYSITNNGSFGTLFTVPLINPPQVAIMSTDAVRKKPVVVETESGDSIAIHPVGVLAQSFDHRAFDGAYSASFLGRVKSLLETRDWAGDFG